AGSFPQMGSVTWPAGRLQPRRQARVRLLRYCANGARFMAPKRRVWRPVLRSDFEPLMDPLTVGAKSAEGVQFADWNGNGVASSGNAQLTLFEQPKDAEELGLS